MLKLDYRFVCEKKKNSCCVASSCVTRLIRQHVPRGERKVVTSRLLLYMGCQSARAHTHIHCDSQKASTFRIHNTRSTLCMIAGTGSSML